ncbi:MAG: excinuclease ABC subunit UvrA, partial [Spirochaetia bacterium]|nr:excinuclease ABC subunit UvrA [Spirochaetia bacterium]
AGRNPRSTVGTVTEIYDFLRLLFSRLGVPHCPKGHGPIQGQTPEMIVDHIARDYADQYILLMAPVVRERKGEYRKELDEIEGKGFLRVRVDGKVIRLDDTEARKGLDLARYEKHTIEIVLDRLRVTAENRTRLDDSVGKALALAEGICSVALAERENLEPSSSENNKSVAERTEKVDAEIAGREAKKNQGETQMQSLREAEKRVRYRVFNTARSCATCGFSVPELEPRLFSFNVPQGACPECSGLGQKQEFHPDHMVKDPGASIFEGALGALNPDGNILYMGSGRNEIAKIFKAWKFDVKTPWRDLPEKFRLRLLTGEGKAKDGINFHIIDSLTWLYDKYRIGHLEKFFHVYECPSCNGLRLNEVARNVLFRGKTIGELSDRQIVDLFNDLEKVSWTEAEKPVAHPILREIRERLSFLVNVGLDYLTLSRRANTLSGGEAQRIRLASQVGSGLEGCLYILDEPSIGLHQSDNKKLIQTLKNLRDRSNTVYVIEHDEETMLSADHLVDVGPEAGVHGGEIMWNGPPLDLLEKEGTASSTRDFLLGKKVIPIPELRREIQKDGRFLEIRGAKRHNLKHLKARFPLGVFTCVTGVSGSGKSTLVLDLLKEGIEKKINEPYVPEEGQENKKKLRPTQVRKPKKEEDKKVQTLEFDSIDGIEHLDKIIEIDQRPIGRTPRSNPATYTSAMNFIRDLFSMVPESKVRGYDKGRFSF